MLFGICPSTSRTSKFWHTYVMMYCDFIVIVKPRDEHASPFHVTDHYPYFLKKSFLMSLGSIQRDQWDKLGSQLTFTFSKSTIEIQNKRCKICSKLKLGSHLPKKFCFICFIEIPLKMMKNVFYFILEALLVLNMFKFLSWFFGHIEKTAWLEDKVNFKIHDVTICVTNNYNTHISQYLTK